jgi:hypothetical protein
MNFYHIGFCSANRDMTLRARVYHLLGGVDPHRPNAVQEIESQVKDCLGQKN